MQTVVDICTEKWRAGLDGDARRLFHGRGHCYAGLEHLVVNWYPPYLQLIVYHDEPELDALRKLVASLLEAGPGVVGVVVQFRQGRRTRSEVWHGNVPDEHVVSEAGCRFFIRPKHNQNVGLFMDMAHVRQALSPTMMGANVLNLFAYTCAFSVAAIAQGARQVVNNDMSRPALQLGERNHVLNGHELRRVRMVPHNLFKSWWKIRQLGPYDVVIIDPPTNQRGSFVAEKSYGQILQRLGEFTSPGGRVVACLNSPFLGPDFLNNQMARWCPQARWEKTYAPHPDFPERFAERGLKVLEFGYPGNRQGGPDR